MPEQLHSVEGRLLASMLDAHGDQLKRIDGTLNRMTVVLENLGRVEERVVAVQGKQDEQDVRLNSHATRLGVIEVEIPPLKEIRKWVIAGVSAALGLIGTGLVSAAVFYVTRQ